jgi:Flp pilus assembly protein TadD
MRVSLWQPAEKERRRLPHWLVALLFVLALLSKPMAVTLPLVLVILDYWPERRLPGPWRTWLLPKLPLFVLAAGSAFVTFLAQSSQGAVAPADHVSIGFRVMNAAHSVVFYLVKAVAPFGLLPLYPIGRTPVGLALANLASAALVLAFTVWLLRRPLARASPLRAAWAFYLVTLAPVLGLIQVGNQLAADRYTYVPLLGPILVLAAGLAASRAGRGLAVAALALCAVLTLQQIATWRDSLTLWGRVVAAYPDVSRVAHANFGNALHEAGRNREAIGEFRRALAIGPDDPVMRNGLGQALLDLGDADAAVASFEAALHLDPAYAVAHRNLWFAWNAKREPTKARAAAEAAVRADPGYAEAWSSLGISQARAGELAAAEASFRRALALDPDNRDYRTNLAVALRQRGRTP